MNSEADWHAVLQDLRDLSSFRAFGMPLDSPGLLDACQEHERTTFTDERTASLAAYGHAQTTPSSLPILCLETGPSFMNALMGLAEILSARLPALVLVDAVAEARRPYGAFQDLALEEIAEALGIRTRVVSAGDRIKEQVLAAATAALESSQPVVVVLRLRRGSDLEHTHNQRRTWGAIPPKVPRHRRITLPSDQALGLIHAQHNNGFRTTVIIGGGARKTSLTATDFNDFAHSIDAELLVTASARGLIDETDPAFAGLAGLYSTPRGQQACTESDCIILLGTAAEETVRERWAPKPGAQLIVVNPSPPPLPVHDGERIDVVEDMTGFVSAEQYKHSNAVRSCSTPPTDIQAHPDNGLHVWDTLETLVRQPIYSTICIENGLHDIWAYDVRCLRLPRPVSIVSCAEQSAMGVAVCGALGAKTNGRVLVICGDSTLRMHLPAVTDAVENRAPITYIVLRDGGMGWPSLSREDARITRFSWNRRLETVLEAIGVAVAPNRDIAQWPQHPGPVAMIIDISMEKPPWEATA
ncbi:thiamine pyrophosphate-dependent enzyme [Auritidibacter ignavus]|uniref:thiamine pyrophosphate-dependent enzyme n=1 Tax=Auritidibacter ignavus TaxID=678932 RepID=UPI0015D5B1A1|nr:thiamine pyrophosphate-dependent enzyme [Auritidibacter ignavus]